MFLQVTNQCQSILLMCSLAMNPWGKYIIWGIDRLILGTFIAASTHSCWLGYLWNYVLQGVIQYHHICSIWWDVPLHLSECNIPNIINTFLWIVLNNARFGQFPVPNQCTRRWPIFHLHLHLQNMYNSKLAQNSLMKLVHYTCKSE